MKFKILVAALAFVSLHPASAGAADVFSWSNHTAPFDFRFGNEIDAHQQSRLTRDGELFGLLYIQFTRTSTKDGYRVATHGDCNAAPCSVGWTFNGKYMTATLLGHEMEAHPLFFAERADIPQPGAFSHFHWLGDLPAVGDNSKGYLLQLVAVDRFCFIHHDAGAASSAKTCRDNGGVKLEIGLDAASHLNIVPSMRSQGM